MEREAYPLLVVIDPKLKPVETQKARSLEGTLSAPEYWGGMGWDATRPCERKDSLLRANLD
eukprot:scaffold324_cov326-Pavlova_lutheri.AAC.36